MRKIYLLTPEQKEFAAAHHDTIDRFLSYHQLDELEYYDTVVFGYLSAVQEYLTKPPLAERYAFSTIAWRSMSDSLKKEWRYQNRSKRKAPTAVYHEDLTPASLDAMLPNRMQAMAEILDDQDTLAWLLSHLTPAEKEMVCLKADGYTCREISEYFHISVSGINNRFYRMRRRLRELSA